jgi:molecular chaperone HtpG
VQASPYHTREKEKKPPSSLILHPSPCAGVVDSEDLPLNVNRETLAQNRVLKVMGKKVVRKVLDMLKKLATTKPEEPKEGEVAKEHPFDTFFKAFGKSIKLGVMEDRANKNKLAKYLRYQTSKSGKDLVSLDDYIAKMPEKQKFIYYITGESVAQVEASPFLERLRQKGYEVIFMVDPLDEYVTSTLTDYEGKTLMSITKDGLKLDEDDTRLQKHYEEDFKPLTEWLKKVYKDKVEKVVVSMRVVDSPCVLVTGQYGWSANMERIMRAQTFGDAEKQQWMISKKTMEINPRHQMLIELKKRVSEGNDNSALEDLAELMYDSAVVASGFQTPSPAEFAARINRVIAVGLDVDPKAALAEEPALPEVAAEKTTSTPEDAPAAEEPAVDVQTEETSDHSKDEL